MTALRAILVFALLISAPAALRAQAKAVVLGSVEDSLGAPLRDVRVQAVGTSVQAVTDARGRFKLGDLSPGTYLLRVRRLGFAQLLVPVELPQAEDSPLAIELRESATDLAPMEIRRNAVSARLAKTGFENRRLFSGAPPGQFVTRADLDRLGAMDLSQMLRRMSSRAWRCTDGIIFLDGVLLVQPPREQAPTAATFTATTTPLLNSTNNAAASAAAGRAIQDAAKSGKSAPKPTSLDMIPAQWIEGMEVYASPAQIPNEYRAAFREAQCVILLWTR